MTLRFSTGLKNKLLGKTVDVVTNGSFTSTTDGWSAVDATLASVAGGQVGNCLRITNNTSAKGYAYQGPTFKKGHRYMIELYHKNGTAPGFVKIGTAPNDASYGSLSLNDSNWTKYYLLVESQSLANVYITLGVDSTTANDTTLFDEVKAIWEASSIQEIFKNSKLQIYSGPQPGSADAGPTGTLLAQITKASSGEFDLEFAEASNGTINKIPTDNWSGQAQATGTAGWFRLITNGDSGVYSTDDCRIDGAIGTSNAELIMADVNIVSGSVQTISAFKLSIPL